MDNERVDNERVDNDGVNDVRIRRGTDADVAGAAQLRWTWVTVDNGDTPIVGREEFVDHVVRWAREHAQTHQLFVAEHESVLVGMAWLAATLRVPSPRALERESADIQSVYVVPEFRGRGVGTMLIAAVTDTARAAGIERVTVHSSVGAVSTYSRAGFESSETLRHLSLTPMGRSHPRKPSAPQG